jgi:hypothetical protein
MAPASWYSVQGDGSSDLLLGGYLDERNMNYLLGNSVLWILMK